MAGSIDNIRKLIQEAGKQPPQGQLIETLEVSNTSAVNTKAFVHEGWDVFAANECDETWTPFSLALMEQIKEMHLSPEELADLLSKVQLSDTHWEWLAKQYLYRGEGYHWFFMFIDGVPQAACLMFHPKESVLSENKNIFYIEYIAVAPWNRDSPLHKAEYKGLGSMLIKSVVNFAENTLNLDRGFSLHALPSADSYYYKIGMELISGYEKGPMNFFEFKCTQLSKFIGEFHCG